MIPSPASLPSGERFQTLIRFLRVVLVVAVALAVAGVFVDGAARAMVVVVIAAPLVRVAWLGVRWVARGDRRYGVVAAGLLAVILVAALLAVLA